MKAIYILGLLALASSTAARAALPQATPAPALQGFAAYRMVRTKNIFDPQRLPLITASAQPRARYEAPPPRPSDYVALTGVLIDGPRSFAFFAGSRQDYNRVAPLNSDIAGAKITKITASNIEVDRGGKKVTVFVGQTVPLAVGSAPGTAPVTYSAPVAPAAPASGGYPSQGADAQPGAQPASPPSSGNSADVIRRMMERRQQQLK